jgi:hypothetical protein
MRPTLKEAGPAARLVAARVYRNAALNHTTVNTAQLVPMDAIIHDALGILGPTGELIVPVRGIYDVSGAVGYVATATVGTRSALLSVDGVLLDMNHLESPAIAEASVIPFNFIGLLLNPGQRVSIQGYQGSSSPLAFTVGASTQTWLSLTLRRPL